MTIFTIDSENHIAAHGSASEVTDKGSEQFTSEKELAQLAADWPGSRLVDIWNRIPGLTPVKRFTNRAVATARIWRAVQSLVSGAHSGNVVSPCDGKTKVVWSSTIVLPAESTSAHPSRSEPMSI